MFIGHLIADLTDFLRLLQPSSTAMQITDWPQLERFMWKLINLDRSAYLGPNHDLEWSNALAEVARAHSADMLTRNYFAHRSPEGQDVGNRIKRTRMPYYLAGENIFLCHVLPSWTQIGGAHRCLMASPGHRQNILNPRFTDVGIGIAANQSRYMITEVFIGV